MSEDSKKVVSFDTDPILESVNPQQRTSDVSSKLLEDRFSIPKFYRDIKSPKESFFSPVDSFIKKSPTHFSSSSNKKSMSPKSRLINMSKRESLRTVADGQEPQLPSKVTTRLSTNTTFIKPPKNMSNSFKNLKMGSEDSPKKLQKDHISSRKINITRIPSPINKSSHRPKIDSKIIQEMTVKQEEADEIIKAEEVERDITPYLENSTDKKPDTHIGGFHKESKPKVDYLNASDLANKILMEERIALKKRFTNMEFTGPNSSISISKLIKTPMDIRSQAISRLEQFPNSTQQSMRQVVEAKAQKGDRSTELYLENTPPPFDFIREFKKEEALKNTESKDESTGKAGNKNVGINMTLIGDKLQVSGAPSRVMRSKSFITSKCETKSVGSCDVQTQTVDLSKERPEHKTVIKNTGSRKRPVLGEVKTKKGKYTTNNSKFHGNLNSSNTEANMRLSEISDRKILPKISKIESPGSSGGSSDGTYTVDQDDAEREEELATIDNISKEGQEHLSKKGKFTGAIANLITKSRAVSFVKQKKTLKNCDSGKVDRSRKIKEIEVSATPENREKCKPKVEEIRTYAKQSIYKKEQIKNSLTTKRTEMTKISESFVEPKLPPRKKSSKMSRIPIPVSPKK